MFNWYPHIQSHFFDPVLHTHTQPHPHHWDLINTQLPSPSFSDYVRTMSTHSPSSGCSPASPLASTLPSPFSLPYSQLLPGITSTVSLSSHISHSHTPFPSYQNYLLNMPICPTLTRFLSCTQVLPLMQKSRP